MNDEINSKIVRSENRLTEFDEWLILLGERQKVDGRRTQITKF